MIFFAFKKSCFILLSLFGCYLNISKGSVYKEEMSYLATLNQFSGWNIDTFSLDPVGQDLVSPNYMVSCEDDEEFMNLKDRHDFVRCLLEFNPELKTKVKILNQKKLEAAKSPKDKNLQKQVKSLSSEWEQKLLAFTLSSFADEDDLESPDSGLTHPVMENIQDSFSAAYFFNSVNQAEVKQSLAEHNAEVRKEKKKLRRLGKKKANNTQETASVEKAKGSIVSIDISTDEEEELTRLMEGRKLGTTPQYRRSSLAGSSADRACESQNSMGLSSTASTPGLPGAADSSPESKPRALRFMDTPSPTSLSPYWNLSGSGLLRSETPGVDSFSLTREPSIDVSSSFAAIGGDVKEHTPMTSI